MDKSKRMNETGSLTAPVCDMGVTTDSDYHLHYKNHDYYFCSQGCEDEFRTAPDKYQNSAPQQENNCVDDSCSLVSSLFTCPMHPKVKQQGDGVVFGFKACLDFCL